MGDRMHQRKTRGFTLVEVLMAGAVATIGFAAIISLQISSMQGNIMAREMSAAVSLAERTAETLQRDSAAWIDPNTIPDGRLKAAPDAWHAFVATPVDHNGRQHKDDDDANGSPLARQRFCIAYRLQTMSSPEYTGLLDARIRVVWPRNTLDLTDLDDACRRPNDFETNVRKFFQVTLPVTVRARQS